MHYTQTLIFNFLSVSFGTGIQKDLNTCVPAESQKY